MSSPRADHYLTKYIDCIPTRDEERFRSLLPEAGPLVLYVLSNDSRVANSEDHWAFRILLEHHNDAGSFDISVFLSLLERALDPRDMKLMRDLSAWLLSCGRGQHKLLVNLLSMTIDEATSSPSGQALREMARMVRFFCERPHLPLTLEPLKYPLNERQALLILHFAPGPRSLLRSALPPKGKVNGRLSYLFEDSSHAVIEIARLVEADPSLRAIAAADEMNFRNSQIPSHLQQKKHAGAI